MSVETISIWMIQSSWIMKSIEEDAMLRTILLVLSVLSASIAGAAEVLVFTDSDHPVKNTGDARVVYLDQAEKVEKEMSAGLPGNIDEAEVVLKERLASPDGARMIEGLTEASKDLMLAWQMGVNKVPAVVIDRQFVVYGQPDVAQAVSRMGQNAGANELRLPSDKLPMIRKPLRLE